MSSMHRGFVGAAILGLSVGLFAIGDAPAQGFRGQGGGQGGGQKGAMKGGMKGGQQFGQGQQFGKGQMGGQGQGVFVQQEIAYLQALQQAVQNGALTPEQLQASLQQRIGVLQNLQQFGGQQFGGGQGFGGQQKGGFKQGQQRQGKR